MTRGCSRLSGFRLTNMVLLILAATITLAPLVYVPGSDGTASFAGADGLAREQIVADHPDYRPWAGAVWTPPSAEVESLLFALQAAAGAGVLGFYLGLRRGEARAEARERADRSAAAQAGEGALDVPG